MTVRKIALFVLFIAASCGLSAQDAAMTAGGGTYRSLTPRDQWELGIHAGVPFVIGDLDPKFPGFGGGLHVRKSLDQIFSVRVGGLYAQMENEGDGDTRTSETSWISGSGQLVVALNNIRFNKPVRKILVNGIIGIGANSFETKFNDILQPDGQVADGTIERELTGHFELGAGLAFRFGPKFNLGIEHTVHSVFGGRADFLDADDNARSSGTTYRDFLHYPHISLNFNLGGNDKSTGLKKSEPLYWVNPMAMTADAIAALEARPIYDPTDTDGDGIIDTIDEEDSSPAGARVDTKGVTLDSDLDKVPDYKDKEPHSPPGYSVDANGVAQVPKPISEADVNRIVDAKLAAFKVPESGVKGWFFPMVNFDLNSYSIKSSNYANLYQVASVMKANPNMKVVVTGYTDASGGEGYNNMLSYNRAKSAIEFLTGTHGIARDRLILNYGGEMNNIITSKGANYTNRRVEFKVAGTETEQPRPEGKGAGRGKFGGNTSGH